MSIESDAYEKHKHLKNAASEIGIPWQTLYVRLKEQGIKVTGDKSRYGSASDRLGCVGEREFKSIVEFSEDMNESEFQSKVDFMVRGFMVDVKSSRPRMLNKTKSDGYSWAFSFKKQAECADFFVCFCYDHDGSVKDLLLIPSEFSKGLQTISVPYDGRSKWKDFSVSKDGLRDFFLSVEKSNL